MEMAYVVAGARPDTLSGKVDVVISANGSADLRWERVTKVRW